MIEDGRRRVLIERVSPELDAGAFPVKRIAGETVCVQADVFGDGHDRVCAEVLFRHGDEQQWHHAPMQHLGSDRWEASFRVEMPGTYAYTIQARIDQFGTWSADMLQRIAAGQDLSLYLLIGAALIAAAAGRAAGRDAETLHGYAERLAGATGILAADIAGSAELGALMRAWTDTARDSRYCRELRVVVEPLLAGFSAWYEVFPRSLGAGPATHGTLRDCEALLPAIARMGFDVLYLPPIHPIGTTNRKGPDNTAAAGPDDPGSPWAIGSAEGGHMAVNPRLGTLEDFERLVASARRHGIEIAIDLAFQCSMDHPYITEHPEWFRWMPDGTVRFAENPPKRYEDVVPFDFECDQWRQLWDELLRIVLFWVERGLRVFRVDNPHTKPIPFWDWLIGQVRGNHPEVIFLAEAFTRPTIKYRLAKGGFSQSYTYFTWRNTKQELTEYMRELTRAPVREYFRSSFWPNTPDILPEYLQLSGRPGFIVRLILAAMLSANYGIYGPAFELLVTEACAGSEEYLHSEKYEIRHWNMDSAGHVRDIITRVNAIRRSHPALQQTTNLSFYETDNEQVLFFGKSSADGSDTILTVISLDPFDAQRAQIRLPLAQFGVGATQPYLLRDLLGGESHIRQGEWLGVELMPQVLPARIYEFGHRLRREHDFDYFF